MLEEAGFTPGSDGIVERDGERLELSLPVVETSNEAVRRAEFIAEDLSDIGIDVTVVPMSWEDFFADAVIALDFDLVTFAWEASPFGIAQARSLVAPIDSNRNFTGVSNDDIEDAFTAAIAQLDDEERYAEIADIDAQLQNQASILPIAALPDVLAVDSELMNFGPQTFGSLDWTLVGFVAD